MTKLYCDRCGREVPLLQRIDFHKNMGKPGQVERRMDVCDPCFDFLLNGSIQIVAPIEADPIPG